MTEATRIRAQMSGNDAIVRVRMTHEMESGQRRDAAGKPIPAWFIQQVTATLNGRVVWTGQWGTAVSKNPYLQFKLRGAKVGDKVAIAWVDNRGERRSDESSVVAAGG